MCNLGPRFSVHIGKEEEENAVCTNYTHPYLRTMRGSVVKYQEHEQAQWKEEERVEWSAVKTRQENCPMNTHSRTMDTHTCDGDKLCLHIAERGRRA